MIWTAVVNSPAADFYTALAGCVTSPPEAELDEGAQIQLAGARDAARLIFAALEDAGTIVRCGMSGSPDAVIVFLARPL